MIEQYCSTQNGVRVYAPAKINLSLLISGKRPDGFHGIETLMAKIDWCDELLFEPGDHAGIELVCRGAYWAPEGPDNLVWRACAMLMEKAGKQVPLKVTLTKNIPAGTGLGSASSDAAAALLGLNRFAGLGQPMEVLHELCAALGSDIAFFLYGPLAYCTGRGEKICPMEQNYDFSVLMIIPGISVATKDVYKNYRHSESEYKALSDKINPLIAKKDVDSAAQICANMLEPSCFDLYGRLAELKDRCEAFCRRRVCLSGSGSAMYVLNPDPKQAMSLREWLKTEFNCESRFVNSNRW